MERGNHHKASIRDDLQNSFKFCAKIGKCEQLIVKA